MVEEVTRDLVQLLGVAEEDIIAISAKTGLNVDKVLQAVAERVPASVADKEKPLRALVFDSHYDSYKGVIAYIRVFDGRISNDKIQMMATGSKIDPPRSGFFNPA